MAASGWIEVGERVFSRRYRFLDQQIGAILTDDGPVIVDTRSTPEHAKELLTDLRRLTSQPVAAAINTHHHFDHAFGNRQLRPAPIWGHVRCAARLRATTVVEIEELAAEYAQVADGLRRVEIDPPDRVFGDEGADPTIGGRSIQIRWLGRGHTDDDVVVVVPDAAVLFAGDLLENGAALWMGDGFPIDWPETVERLRPLSTGAVVPGHGAVADLAFVERSIAELRAIAELARRVHRGEIGLEDAVTAAPWRPAESGEALDRALAQLRGELDGT